VIQDTSAAYRCILPTHFRNATPTLRFCQKRFADRRKARCIFNVHGVAATLDRHGAEPAVQMRHLTRDHSILCVTAAMHHKRILPDPGQPHCATLNVTEGKKEKENTKGGCAIIDVTEGKGAFNHGESVEERVFGQD